MLIVKAKRWIHAVQCLAFSGSGGFGISMGTATAVFDFKNANGDSAQDAVVPLLIIGGFFLLFGSMTGMQWMMLRSPLITASPGGLTCLVVGGYRQGIFAWLPTMVQTMILIVSGRGFRGAVCTAEWDAVEQISLKGTPGYRKLEIRGQFIDRISGHAYGSVTYADAAVVGDIGVIYEHLKEIRQTTLGY